MTAFTLHAVYEKRLFAKLPTIQLNMSSNGLWVIGVARPQYFYLLILNNVISCNYRQHKQRNIGIK